VDDVLKKEVDALRADLQKLAADIKGLTKTVGKRTAAEASEGLEHIKETGEQLEARLRKAADEAKSSLETQVKERPLGTLLIAFGLGLLFGKSIGR
jgi:ElaB/YqjD/DUF883 family membrane-anchored ribosome-binding protein